MIVFWEHYYTQSRYTYKKIFKGVIYLIFSTLTSSFLSLQRKQKFKYFLRKLIKITYNKFLFFLELSLYSCNKAIFKELLFLKQVNTNILFSFLQQNDLISIAKKENKILVFTCFSNWVQFKSIYSGFYCNLITRGRGFSFKIKEWTSSLKGIRISAGAHRFFDYYFKYPVFFILLERAKALCFSWQQKYLTDEILCLRHFINQHSLPYKEQGVFYKNERIFLKQGKRKKKGSNSSW